MQKVLLAGQGNVGKSCFIGCIWPGAICAGEYLHYSHFKQASMNILEYPFVDTSGAAVCMICIINHCQFRKDLCEALSNAVLRVLVVGRIDENADAGCLHQARRICQKREISFFTFSCMEEVSEAYRRIFIACLDSQPQECIKKELLLAIPFGMDDVEPADIDVLCSDAEEEQNMSMENDKESVFSASSGQKEVISTFMQNLIRSIKKQ